MREMSAHHSVSVCRHEREKFWEEEKRAAEEYKARPDHCASFSSAGGPVAAGFSYCPPKTPA